jgi:hypothetical protein
MKNNVKSKQKKIDEERKERVRQKLLARLAELNESDDEMDEESASLNN